MKKGMNMIDGKKDITTNREKCIAHWGKNLKKKKLNVYGGWEVDTYITNWI